MAGTLFFDGKCGMCTRSRNLLLKLNRTGDLLTEPLQTPGTAERLGITDASLMDAVRWLDATGDVYAGAEAANAAVSAALGTRLPLMIYRIPGIRSLEDLCTAGSPIIATASPAPPRIASRIPSPADPRR